MTLKHEISGSFLAGFGVERLVQTGVYTVQDGLIVVEDVVLDLSDPQTAQCWGIVLAASAPTPPDAGNLGPASTGPGPGVLLSGLLLATLVGALVAVRYLAGATTAPFHN